MAIWFRLFSFFGWLRTGWLGGLGLGTGWFGLRTGWLSWLGLLTGWFNLLTGWLSWLRTGPSFGSPCSC